MRRVLFYTILTTLTLFLFTGKSVLAQVSSFVPPGNPTGFINDFAGMLKPETKTGLETILTDFTKETSTEISVVTVQNLGGDSIENYANELFRAWGIGTKEHNNGILFLISKEDRKLRIEVGYGLEGALPDATASSIIRNDITPLFKEGKYDEGVVIGVEKIMSATKGEYTKVPEKRKGLSINGDILQFLFIVFIIFCNVLISILAPSKSWWLGGVIGGVIGGIIGFIFWSIIGGAILGVILLGLGLLIDFLASRSYQKNGGGKRGPWGPGGFFGGGMSSGGGFGGFSGGSSGGGGSSGSW